MVTKFPPDVVRLEDFHFDRDSRDKRARSKKLTHNNSNVLKLETSPKSCEKTDFERSKFKAE
tara:strand:- start:1950 stop:2135 length:186 start_codon:yes stop_codon:yes gene_type:complete